MEQLKNYFPFLAILGTIGLVWSQLKNVFVRCYSLFLNNIELRYYAGGAVCMYLWHHTKPIDSGIYTYECRLLNVKNVLAEILVGTKKISNKYQLFFYNKVPLLAKMDHNTNVFNLCFIRGTIDFDKFFQLAVDYWNQITAFSKNNRFRIVNLVGERKNQLKIDDLKSNLSSTAPTQANFPNQKHDIFFGLSGKLLKYNFEDIGVNYSQLSEAYVFDETANEIFNEIKGWVALKNWYKEKGLQWRRGYALTGQPGNGKSSFVRALGIEFDLPIFKFDLSSMSNQDFIEKWDQLNGNVPCIALFEDLDGVFDKRLNVTGIENALSFDCLINALSGVLPADGILTFVTTNKPESIDEALSRPGRLDKKIQITKLSLENKRKLAEKILGGYNQETDEIMKDAESLSNAEFTEKCTKIALDRLWNKT